MSRSAATIVGGSLIGVSEADDRRVLVHARGADDARGDAGSSWSRAARRSRGNYGVLAVGFVVSFITAIVAIKSFLGYIKKRDFSAFGWYRIVLAVVYFLVFVR